MRRIRGRPGPPGRGSPELPPPFATRELASWTQIGGEAAQRFAGTAVYSLTFDAPAPADRTSRWVLDLGKVSQSARVRLNGRDFGTIFIPPFRVPLPALEPTGNRLEVEVTNASVWPIHESGLLGPVTLTPTAKDPAPRR